MLPRLVGETKAKEIIFSARQVDAKEAIEIGLATSPLLLSVESSSSSSTVITTTTSNETSNNNNTLTARRSAELFLEKCAENAPLAVRYAKRTLRELFHEPNVQIAVHKSRKPREELAGTFDHREALNAFAEKRKPVFQGR